MKRFFRTVLMFLPLLAVIFGVNYYADPAGLVNRQAERQVAEALNAGRNAGKVETIDDRAMMGFLFEERKKEIECLILGASRGMQVSKETTGIEETFNAGVTGAELRDMISIYYMYTERFADPQRVIITLEPWTLSATYTNKRALTEGYYEFCSRAGLEPIRTNNTRAQIERILELFTIRYFQQSVNPVFSGNFDLKRHIVVTDLPRGEYDIRHRDGSYSYSNGYTSMSETEKASLLNDMKTRLPDMIREYEYSGQLEAQLRAFVGMLSERGVKVTFFIPPILPEYYGFLVEEGRDACFSDSMRAYEDIAREYDIDIVGCYNDDGMTARDFYEVLHPTYEYVYGLFSGYRREAGA